MEHGHFAPGLCPAHCLFLFIAFDLSRVIEMRTSSESQSHFKESLVFLSILKSRK